MNMKRIFFIAWISLSMITTSCLEPSEVEDPAVQLNKEVTAIDNYLISSGAQNVISDVSGIRIVVEEMGVGLPARLNSVIDIDYVGSFFHPVTGEGEVFDEGNIDETDTSTGGKLNKLITGWRYCLTRLPEGTKAKLFLPSAWAYGSTSIRDSQGNVVIPANSTLVFDIEFNEVVWTATEINRFKTDTTAIENYLAIEEITDYEVDETGVRYTITQQGVGLNPYWFDKVKFSYKYYYLSNDQVVISQGTLEPNALSNSRLCDYLQGFAIPLSKLNAGGKIRAYVPSIYCYGPEGITSGTLTVPANTILIFDLELISVPL